MWEGSSPAHSMYRTLLSKISGSVTSKCEHFQVILMTAMAQGFPAVFRTSLSEGGITHAHHHLMAETLVIDKQGGACMMK